MKILEDTDPNPASTLRKHLGILQSSNHCKQTFSSPPVLAYKRSASLRDLLVRTRLRDPKNKDQRSTAAFTDVSIHVASRVLSYKMGKKNISFFLLRKNDALKTL